MLDTLKSFKMTKNSSLMGWFSGSASKDDVLSQEAAVKVPADIASIKEVAENSSSSDNVPIEHIELEAFQ